MCNLVAELERRFRDEALTSAAQAATIILDGVKADRWRILVGADAPRYQKFESISLQRRVTQTSSADARSRPDPSEYERGADGQDALGDRISKRDSAIAPGQPHPQRKGRSAG